MKKLSLSLLILITLISCDYNSVHLLDDDDLAWMEAYENGDTVLFASTEGMDTMFVSRIINNNRHPPFGIYCFTDHTGNALYEDTIVHRQEKISQSFYMVRELDDKTHLSLIFNNRLCNARLCDARFILPKVKLKDVEVGDSVYHDCIIVDSLNSHVIRESDLNCDFLVWSKSKGLIQYKYQNGETYSLYKILPNKKGKKKCASSILPVNAQNISIDYLIENTWFDIDDSPRDNLFIDTLRVTFDKKNIFFFQHSIVEHPTTKKMIDKSGESASLYYLSDTIPQRFDKTKVGKSTSGKYLVLLNDSSNYSDYYVWELNIKDSSTLEFTLSKFPLDDYIDSIGRKILLKKDQ